MIRELDFEEKERGRDSCRQSGQAADVGFMSRELRGYLQKKQKTGAFLRDGQVARWLGVLRCQVRQSQRGTAHTYTVPGSLCGVSELFSKEQRW